MWPRSSGLSSKLDLWIVKLLGEEYQPKQIGTFVKNKKRKKVLRRWVPRQERKLFIGSPASPNSSCSGHVPPYNLGIIIQDTRRSFPSFGELRCETRVERSVRAHC